MPKFYVTTTAQAWVNTTWEVEADTPEAAEAIIDGRIEGGSLGEHRPVDEAFIEDRESAPQIIDTELVPGPTRSAA